MDNNLTFGEWLKQRRKALDLTQNALAQRARCAYGTIRRLEADELRPSRQLAELLATAVEVPAAQIEHFIAFARDLPGATAFTLPPALEMRSSPSTPRPLPSTPIRATLPKTLTILVGRNHEIEVITKLLLQPTVRLLTLTGAPGVGKTRLALEVATQLIEQFADGVVFVPLDPVREATFVPNTLAQALGLQEGGQALATMLIECLQHRQTLLLIDNFEHLLEAAPLLTQLLTHAPRLKMLVTSRTVLHLSGEHEFPVPPLALPTKLDEPLPNQAMVATLATNPAIALFCTRAQSAQPSFVLTPTTAAAICEICQRLDGLPLALELAAMRVKLFPPQLLLARLQQRLPSLADGPRDAPARQKTVEAAIAWSYDLLTPAQQLIFVRLASFAGGWTLAAAEVVCGSEGLIETLAALVDHSLLQIDEGQAAPQQSEPRFRMLQVIREYALTRLQQRGEAATIARHHAQAFQQLAEQAAEGLHGAKRAFGEPSPNWMARLETESDNLRAALAWSVTAEGDVEIGLTIAAKLEWYWRGSGRRNEGRYWLEQLLAHSTGCSEMRALGLTGAGILAFFAGEFVQAEQRFAQALTCAKEHALPLIEGYAQMHTGLMQVMQGELAAARANLDHARTLLHTLSEPALWYWGATSIACGLAAMAEADWDGAEAYVTDCLAVSSRFAHPYGTASGHNFLGDVLRVKGRHQEAAYHYETCLQLLQQSGVRGDLPAVMHNVAYGALQQGEFARAATLLRQALLMQRDNGNQAGMAECLCGFAALALTQARAEAAAQLFGAVAAIETKSDMPIWPAEAAARAPYQRATRQQLGDVAYATAFAVGQSLPLEQVLAEVVAVTDKLSRANTA